MTRALTRQQVLKWRETWSYTDLELIEHALDQLPEDDYYEPRSASYAAARVNGKVALYVAPGYLYWPKARWSADLDLSLFPGGLTSESNGDAWFALSNFRGPAHGKRTFEELSAPCPTCFMVPSVSGACACD